ncbi:MAG: helix-turn-helix domain-containing protein [Bacteroidota bacterium]
MEDVGSSPWLEKLLAIVDYQLGQQKLDNQKLAAEMGLSKRQLYRKVKNLTDTSPNLYIRKYRLDKAWQLIESGQFQTVQQIGIAVGYQNIHYFSKEFEKEFGEKPLQVLIRLGYR